MEHRAPAALAAHHELRDQLGTIVLVLDRAQGLVTDRAQEGAEGGIPRGRAPDDHRVDEVADGGRELGASATGHRRPDQDLLLARLPSQEHLIRGQQHHVRRRALARGELSQPPTEILVQQEGQTAPGTGDSAGADGRCGACARGVTRELGSQ